MYSEFLKPMIKKPGRNGSFEFHPKLFVEELYKSSLTI